MFSIERVGGLFALLFAAIILAPIQYRLSIVRSDVVPTAITFCSPAKN
jgi:hypothetical protein